MTRKRSKNYKAKQKLLPGNKIGEWFDSVLIC
ncbi:MAG: hypothetical protein ACI9A1_000775, partial [Lentimonas sp.]